MCACECVYEFVWLCPLLSKLNTIKSLIVTGNFVQIHFLCRTYIADEIVSGPEQASERCKKINRATE